jgi:hypothetical protein
MNLECGLRCEHDARAASDVNRLADSVAAKQAWTGANENQVRGIANRERPSDAHRRLGVRVRDRRPSTAPLEDKLEPCVAADRGRRSRVARLKPSRYISPQSDGRR